MFLPRRRECHRQKRGLGTALTRRVLKTAEDNKIENVVLTSSHVAEKLYQKVGFAPIGSIVVLQKSGNISEHILENNSAVCTAEEISNQYYARSSIRTKILEKMLLGSGSSVCVKGTNGEIEGFASSLKRVFENGHQSLAVGPILANSNEAVGKLLDHFLASTSLDLTCLILQNFSGETEQTKESRGKILGEFNSRAFKKVDELLFMSYGGKKIDQYIDSRIISPISLAFG